MATITDLLYRIYHNNIGLAKQCQTTIDLDIHSDHLELSNSSELEKILDETVKFLLKTKRGKKIVISTQGQQILIDYSSAIFTRAECQQLTHDNLVYVRSRAGFGTSITFNLPKLDQKGLV